MRTYWIYVVGLICLFFLAVYGLKFSERRGGGGEGEPANVIVILIDALRADHVGSFGYHRETTPNLDRLSEKAVTFTRTYSPSSWTKPSIPSLFTSLYPSRHGVFEGSSKDKLGFITSDILQDSLVTIAERFRDHGYQTAAFVHNAQLKGFLGFSQGFDLYQDKVKGADEINTSFNKWLDERGEAPFFAYLHYLEVHWPYQPPAPYDTLFGTYSSDINFNTDQWKDLRGRINDGEIKLGDEDLDKMISLYDGELRYLDEQIGSLLFSLERKGIYDNTLLVVTADHGESFLEHGKIGHGHSLHKELIWVPLIIKFPNRRWQGERVAVYAELVDILPSLADFLGWEPLPVSDGESLIPLIEGEDSVSIAYSELLHKDTYQRAIIGNNYKLVETYSGNFRSSDSPSPLKNLRVGDRIEVDGNTGEGYTFVADKISLDENQSDNDDEIEGSITGIARNQGSFELMNLEIIPEQDVLVKGVDGEIIEFGDLRDGMRVKANGYVLDGRIYKVDRVIVKGSEGRGFTIEGIIDDLQFNGNEEVSISIMGYKIVVDVGNGADNRGRSESNTAQLVKTELYDLSMDPEEAKDIAHLRPDVVEEVQLLLNEKFPSIVNNTSRRSSEVRELDTETIEELRAIGYIK